MKNFILLTFFLFFLRVITVNGEGGEVEEGGGGPRFAISEERAKAHDGKQAMSEERAKAHDGKWAVQGRRWGPSCGGFWCWVEYIIRWIVIVGSILICICACCVC